MTADSDPSASRAGEDPAGAEDELSLEEAMRRLEARLLQASQAADRLMREAAGRMTGQPGGSDPSDSQSEDSSNTASSAELPPVWERLIDLVPPDLQRRLADALRELLLAVRALLDWYIERLERDRPEPPEVKDIPIL